MSAKIKKAASMAGDWWASRLSEKYQPKKTEFSKEVARLIELEMLGEITYKHEYFDHVCSNGQTIKCGRYVQSKGDGEKTECWTEFDYDPCPLLEDAIDKVFPDLDYFEKKKILPMKRALKVYEDHLNQKDGYGNQLPDIPIT